MTDIRCSIIIPAKNEQENIEFTLNRILESMQLPFECIVVVDDENDLSKSKMAELNFNENIFRCIVNRGKSGFASAVRTGIQASRASVIVVTMADGSDDPEDISQLVKLIERGVTVSCASRYIPGGQQIGAPKIKSYLSRVAGKSFSLITNAQTLDPTNNFKAYSKEFIQKYGIQSENGFEVGLELVAKAVRHKLLIAEVPTIWIERNLGVSKFKILKSLPVYLKWYLYGVGIIRRHSKIYN